MDLKIYSDGEIVNCNVITLFKDEKNNNDYIVYTDNTLDEDGKKNIYGSRYRLIDGKIELIEIEEEYEWDIIDDKIRSIDNNEN